MRFLSVETHANLMIFFFCGFSSPCLYLERARFHHCVLNYCSLHIHTGANVWLCDYVIKVSNYFSRQSLKTKGQKHVIYSQSLTVLIVIWCFSLGSICVWFVSLTLTVQISIVLHSYSASTVYSPSEPAGGVRSLYIRCQEPNRERLWLYSTNDHQTLLPY